MEVIKLAWYEEQFSYRGKHIVLPPDDVPDRGTMVNDLTLVPKPLRHVDIYQPVTSPETIEYVPKAGHKAVYWLQNADSQKQKWGRYAEIREAWWVVVRAYPRGVRHTGGPRRGSLPRAQPAHRRNARGRAGEGPSGPGR